MIRVITIFSTLKDIHSNTFAKFSEKLPQEFLMKKISLLCGSNWCENIKKKINANNTYNQHTCSINLFSKSCIRGTFWPWKIYSLIIIGYWFPAADLDSDICAWRPQVGPMLAPWTLLSGKLVEVIRTTWVSVISTIDPFRTHWLR